MKHALLLLLILLGACAPARQDNYPQVALLNGPTENRVKGLADELQIELASRSNTPYGLVSPFVLRFQETHRDMYRSRARSQAASIARSKGADYAVLVGLADERNIVGESVKDGFVSFTVLIDGSLEASVIDAANAETLEVFSSPVTETRKNVSLPLPEGVTVLNPELRKLINQEADKVTLSALELQDKSDTALTNLADELNGFLSQSVN